MTERTPRPKARDLNQVIRYTMWSVFRLRDQLPQGREGVVAGFRADADFMFWWHAPSAEDLQEVYTRFRRTALGRAAEPVWSAMALHRPAEFNKSHIPAFLAEEEPRGFVCVYPFVRSLEW